MSETASDYFNKRIDKASNAAECEPIEADLKALLSKVKAKREGLENQDREAGLNFQGANATKCPCGSSVDPQGLYYDTCGACKKSFCLECFQNCDDCGEQFCRCFEQEDNCIFTCEGCESKDLCQNCFKTCEYCESTKMCKDCPNAKEIPPYGQVLCPNCYDCMCDSYF